VIRGVARWGGRGWDAAATCSRVEGAENWAVK